VWLEARPGSSPYEYLVLSTITVHGSFVLLY
jgi:hypothetical protein